MTLVCDGLLLLPPRGPVRIVAASIGGDVVQLQRLFESVELVAQRCHVARENRAYTPHVTLARAGRRPMSPATRPTLQQTLGKRWPGPSWECRSFALIQSVLGPAGATYTKLAEFPT